MQVWMHVWTNLKVKIDSPKRPDLANFKTFGDT